MRRGVAVLCLAAAFGAARAETPSEVEGQRFFGQGVAALQRGEPACDLFRAAADAFAKPGRRYEAVHDFNIGNSRYLAGQLPEAIAAYNAGFLRDPFDARLRTNLNLARRDVELSNGVRRVGRWQERLFQPWLGLAAKIALVAASLLLPFGIGSGRRAVAILGGVAVLVAGGLLAALVIREQFLADLRERPVVIIRVETPLFAGNAQSYDSELVLPRGFEVRRVGERGDWLHVECPDGSVGWIPRAGGIEP